MLLIQGERSLVSDVIWLCNCDSFRRRPAQRNKKKSMHALPQMLRDNNAFDSEASIKSVQSESTCPDFIL